MLALRDDVPKMPRDRAYLTGSVCLLDREGVLLHPEFPQNTFDDFPLHTRDFR